MYLLAIGSVLVMPWVLWTLFVAAMHLNRVEREIGLTLPQKIFGTPLKGLTWSISVLFNFSLGILICRLDPPREPTFSERLYRYRKTPAWKDTKNERTAIWIQEDLLADFDETGYHGTSTRWPKADGGPTMLAINCTTDSQGD